MGGISGGKRKGSHLSDQDVQPLFASTIYPGAWTLSTIRSARGTAKICREIGEQEKSQQIVRVVRNGEILGVD